MVKRTITITMILLILTIAVGLIIVLNKSSFAADDDIARGTSGTCSWVIDAGGVLNISPTNGNVGQLASTTGGNGPWYSYRSSITKVTFEPGVKTGAGCYSLFYYFYECTEIDLSNLDTSDATNMEQMFYGCSKISSLDVSGFDTSNVTNMSYMFGSCSNITSLDVSNFNTSNVTNMEGMFCLCFDLVSLDISGFNTSNVVNMRSIFSSDASLTSIDVSGFDTSNVTDMSSMFNGCEQLSALDVTGFNTSKVTNMLAMFYRCKSLTTLDVSRFDTAKVTNMINMFNECSNLTSLDVSVFHTENVTSMMNMFNNCSSIISLDLSGFDTSKVTSMYSMFSGCSKLESLNISSFDTSRATNLKDMFMAGSKLSSITLGERFKFEGNNSDSNKKAIFPYPSAPGCTGKWIRSDKEYGPYGVFELRENYTSVMAGEWVWDVLDIDYNVKYSYIGKIPDGASELPAEGTYKQGDEVTVADAATAPGYIFSGWSRTGTFEMPGENVEITGSFTAKTDTPYIVEHYVEDLKADTFTLAKTENLTGTTDTEVSAAAKDYEGFSFNNNIEGTIQNGSIKGDGSQVLKLYYKRNSYNVSYSYTGDIPEGASALPQNETYEYQEEIKVPDDAVAEGYTFSGWIKDYITMPAHDIEITGHFIEIPKSYCYKVKYFFDGELDDSLDEILNAEKDEEISIIPQTPLIHGEKNYILVSNNHKITISINDEDNVIEVYYESDVLDYEFEIPEGDGIPDKYQVKITYKVENGFWNDGTKENKIEIVTLKDKEGNPSKEGIGEPHLPEAGEKPAEGYIKGTWSSKIPSKVSNKDNGKEYIYSYEKVAKVDIVEPEGNSSNPKTDDVFHRYLTYCGLGMITLMVAIKIRRKYSRKARKIQL